MRVQWILEDVTPTPTPTPTQPSTTPQNNTILGCTNSNATNHDPNATQDDGSCIILGCTNSNATNITKTQHKMMEVV